MPRRFCAICGSDIDEEAPHFAMCLNCYLQENPLFKLPDQFDIKVCNSCGKFSKKELWMKSNSYEILDIIVQAIQEILLNAIKAADQIQFKIKPIENSIEYTSKNLIKSIDIKISGHLKKNPKISKVLVISTRINYEMCKNCINLRGGKYYTSILQLRTAKEEKEFIQYPLNQIIKYTKKLFEEDERQYISDILDLKNGYDLYLSTNELLNHIISYLRGKYHFGLIRTKKLVGRDNQRGKNIYRLKAVIRFLPFEKNNYIVINDSVYLIENIKKKMVFLRDNKENRIIKSYDYFFSDKISIKRFEDDSIENE